MSKFGDKVRRLRENKKMSTRMLAEEIKISCGQISKYENNLVDPTLTMLKKYGDYFEVSLDYLCNDEEE